MSEVHECNFNECCFEDSDIVLSTLKFCDFNNADFQNLTVEKSSFIYCNLDGIIIAGWKPSELKFIDPDISHAKFDSDESDIVHFKNAEEFFDEANKHLNIIQENDLFTLGEPKAICFTHETGRSPRYLMTEDEVQKMIDRERNFEHFLVCYKEYSRVSKKSGRRRPEENLTSAELEVLIAYLQLFVKHESALSPLAVKEFFRMK